MEFIKQRDEEIKSLSEQIRALEAQMERLQHPPPPSTSSKPSSVRELELEEQLHQLTVETSEMRVKLVEAEDKKQEAVSQLESYGRKAEHLQQVIADLENKRKQNVIHEAVVAYCSACQDDIVEY